MHTRVFLSLFLSLGLLILAARAQPEVAAARVTEGRAALVAHDLATARQKFSEARTADPTNQAAAALLGLTRWAALAGDAPAQTVLNQAAVAATGRDVYNWTAAFSENSDGETTLPAGYNLESTRAFWRDTVLVTSAAARADFAAVTDPAFVLTLTAQETGGHHDVTFDRADLMVATAALRAFEALAQLGLGQNFNGDYARMLELAHGELLTFRKALEDNPDLLKAGSLTHRLAAKEAILDFVALYRQASAVLRARAPGLDRLFMLETDEDFKDEAEFRAYLVELEKSVTSYVEFDKGQMNVSLAPLATAEWSLRDVLPPMTNGRFNPAAIGDASFGAIALGVRREWFAEQLVDAGYVADIGWTIVNPTPVASGFNKSIYTGTHYLATATNGKIARSADGVNWTLLTLPDAQDLFSIDSNGNGVVVAVGNTQIWRSTDHGATWNLVKVTWKRTAPDNEGALFGLAHDGAKFLAITNNGFVWTSPEGKKWTRGSRIAPTSISLSLTGLTYAGGRFLAYGLGLVPALNSSRSIIYTSTDGRSWTQVFAGAATGLYRAAAYHDGRWVVAGASGRIASSFDGGVSWSEIFTGNTADNFLGAAYAGGQFVLAGSVLATSADALTWSYLQNPESISFGGASAGPNGVLLPGPQGALYRFAGGAFTRLDTNQGITPRTLNFNRQVVLNGKLYFVSNTSNVHESADGQTFTARDTGFSGVLGALVAHEGQLFAAGSQGTILSSSDGVSWQVRVSNDLALTNNATLTDLYSCNGLLFAVSGSLMIASNDNGATWTRRTLPTSSGSVVNVSHVGGMYVAGMSASIVNSTYWEISLLVSADGANWTRQVIWYQPVITGVTTVIPHVRGVFQHEGKFYAMIANGTVIRSSALSSGAWEWVEDGLGTLLITSKLSHALVAVSARLQDEARAGFRYSFDAEEWMRTELPVSSSFSGRPLEFNNRIFLSGFGATILRSNNPLTRPGPASGSAITIAGETGRSVTLAAPFATSEDLTYQWSFNGTPIVGATGANLTLSDLSSLRAGTYTVTATGVLTGATATNTVTLTVTDGKPAITQQPVGGPVVSGGSVTLSVAATGAAPLSYQWFRNNSPIFGATAATHTIASFSSADEGTYRVDVTNPVGTTVSAGALLSTATTAGAAPAFWDGSDSYYSPSRTIHDSAGRVYAMWNVSGYGHNVVGGQATARLVRLFESNGQLDSTFAWDDRLGSPLFMVIQGDGKLLVAVTQAQGEGATVVRVNPDGSHDASYVAPRFGRSIRFMSLQPDGKLLLSATDSTGDTALLPAGAITVTNPTVYRLDLTGGLDAGFTPVELTLGGTVFVPPAVDTAGRIYILGSFNAVNGVTRRGVARVDSSGVLDASFADAAALPAGWSTSTVARGIGFQSDGKIVLAGRFAYTAKTTTSNPILAVRFNADGTFDSTFAQPLRSETPINPSIGFYARYLVMDADDKFFLTDDRLMRFNANGTLDAAWPTNTVGYEKEIFWLSRSPSTGRLFLPDLGSVPGGIRAISPDGQVYSGFNPGGFGTTTVPGSAVVLADGRVLAAGIFDHFGAAPQPGTALFGTNGTILADNTAFHDPGVRYKDPYAEVFQWPDRSFGVLRIDNLDITTGAYEAKLDRFNADGSPRIGWALDDPSPERWNYTPLLDGGLLVWRATLDTTPTITALVNNTPLTWIRRFRADGSYDPSFAPSLGLIAQLTRNGSNAITAVNLGGLADVKVAADGGILLLVAGLDGKVSLRRLLPDGQVDPSYTPTAIANTTATTAFTSSFIYDPLTGINQQIQHTVHANFRIRLAALPDGSAYLAGDLSVAGVARNLVKLTSSGAVDAGFADPMLVFSNPLNLPARVTSLGLDDSGRLYVGGRFTLIGGHATVGLARYNRSGVLDTSWTPAVDIRDYLLQGSLMFGSRGWLHVMGQASPGGYRRVAIDTLAPQFLAQPADRTLTAGENGYLSAAVWGGSGATYQWTRNGVAIDAANLPYLSLGTVTAGTAGTYRLTVTNSSGSVSSSEFIVTVSALPRIVSQPEAASVAHGASVTFSVEVISGSPVTYQWRRNETAIVGATSSSLTIAPVTTAEAGDYSVVVTNAAGSVTSAAATLTVGTAPSAPVITVQPVGQTVVPGYSTTLSVTATGTGLSYQWYRDGAAITGATGANYTTGNPTAAQTFHVVVRGSNGGSVTSNPAVLTVVPGYVVGAFAGSVSTGSTDGSGAAARFNFPAGAVADAAGNVYIADTSNHVIRKLASDGVVTTWIGTAGSAGFVNGSGSAVRLNTPRGLALDASGNLYIAESGNHSIRKVTPTGVVTTVAGSGSAGTTDGVGSAARFNSPRGLAMGSDGVLYVADTSNHAIRRIAPDGTVTTLAGLAGFSGNGDGTGSTARFNSPYGLCLDGSDGLVVADSSSYTLRKVSLAGVVTTLAGQAGVSGSGDGTGTAARFSFPTAVTPDGAGGFVVTDNNSLRQVSSSAVVTTLAGQTFTSGSIDATGTAARFNFPQSVVRAANGHFYVADTNNNVVRQVTTGGVVTTVAGSAPANTDGTGSAARFNRPTGMAFAPNGDIILADYNNHTIRRITPAGVVTTVAGAPGVSGAVDGAVAMARFNYPRDVAVSPSGIIYVADGTNAVRKIEGGNVSTLAGALFFSGTSDGTGGAARFGLLQGIAIDAAGDLYVSDSQYHTIRKVTAAGVVTTVAGLAGSSGSTDGTGTAARFNFPYGIAIDPNGDLFVADTNGRTIRKVTPAGVVTTFAGLANTNSTTDGAGSLARFSQPRYLKFDASGDLWVTDGAQLLRRITPSGVVTTFAGLGFAPGIVDGSGSTARFNSPEGVLVDAAGYVYVADASNHVIRRAFSGALLQITTQPVAVNTIIGASATLSVVASGQGTLAYQWTKDGADLPGQTSASLALTNLQAINAGTYAVRVTNGTQTIVSTNAVVVVSAPNANDNFANPTTLNGFTSGAQSSNTVATGEVGEGTHFSTNTTASSIWFVWTAPSSGLASFDTFGSSFDTAMAVYTGDSLASLSFLAQNNDAGGTTQSRVALPVVAGTTYRIAVGSTSTTRGTVQFNVGLMVLPAPSAQIVTRGQAGSITAQTDPMASPALAVSWNKNGADAGVAGSTLTVAAAGFADAGVYLPGFAQGAAPDFSRSLPAYLLVAGNGSLAATDSFPGTGLGTGWVSTQVGTPTADDTAFGGNERLQFITPVTPTGAVTREAIRTATLPLDRNWTVILRTGVTTVEITGLNGTGNTAREAGMALFVRNPNDTTDVLSTGFRAYNTTGQPLLQRFAQLRTNATPSTLSAEPHSGLPSTLLRFDYNSTTGTVTALSSTGGAFVSLGTVDVLTQWTLSRSGALELGVRGFSNAVNTPAGSVWADDFASLIQPPLPVITAQPVSQTVAAGANVTLGVTATNVDTYQWYQNGNLLSLGTGANLSLTAVDGTAAGNYTVIVTNGAGSVTSDPALLTVNTAGYASWQGSRFSTVELANASISGPLADPDGDGLSNLVEYALGFEPRTANAASLPEVDKTTTDWTYTYQRPAERTDLTYVVEVSTNLTSWTVAGVTHTLVSTSGGVETWQASYPLASATNVFFRLRVDRP